MFFDLTGHLDALVNDISLMVDTNFVIMSERLSQIEEQDDKYSDWISLSEPLPWLWHVTWRSALKINDN